MAAIAKFTRDQLKNARKAGFRRKKPNKPKAGASLNSLEAWVLRYNDWVKDMKEKDREHKKNLTDKKKREKLKRDISGV